MSFYYAEQNLHSIQKPVREAPAWKALRNVAVSDKHYNCTTVIVFPDRSLEILSFRTQSIPMDTSSTAAHVISILPADIRVQDFARDDVIPARREQLTRLFFCSIQTDCERLITGVNVDVSRRACVCSIILDQMNLAQARCYGGRPYRRRPRRCRG